MGKPVWGIDVGKSSVKAVRMELRQGEAAISGIEVVSYPVPEGEETPDLDLRIVDALQELKSVCKFGTDPVLISLPGHSTFNRLIKLPPVEDEKIPEIVQYEAQSQIPFNIDEVLWDYQVIDREYQPGEEKEVILFAIKRDIVDGFLANIAPVGLNIEVIQFAPVALYNYLSYDQEIAGAAIALDMGGENTDLVIVDGAKFWIRNLPITGDDITKALQKGFSLPFGEAEKLKLKAGQSQQAQKIFNAIQPVLRDLVGEIHRSIGYYKSISKTAKFERIILLGNATKTLNFQKFVSQSLSTMGNLPAARLQKLGKINADDVEPAVLNRHLATLGAALGLALQGLGLAKNGVNLLPDTFKKKKEIQKKRPWIVGAVAALYVLVFTVWFVTSGKVDSLEKIQKDAQSGEKQYLSLKGQYDTAKSVDQLKTHLETVAAISPERDLLVKILNRLNACIPKNGEVPEQERMWLVDVKAEEVPREAPKPAEGAAQNKLPWAVKRNLKVEIEVVTVKGDDAIVGTKFVVDRLLRPKSKDGLLATVHLEDRQRGIGDGVGWEVPTPQETDIPFSSGKVRGDSDPPGPPIYWRFKIQLAVPLGSRDRPSLLAPNP